MSSHRREFLKLSSALGLGLLLPTLPACTTPDSSRHISVRVNGPNYRRGHQTRGRKDMLEKTVVLEKDVVIIGAGVSGLSAAWFLHKNNHRNLLLLEVNDVPGGNASYGKNAYSAYPHGAHYISLPSTDNRPLVGFLQEKGIITRIDEEGRIHYNETDLCFDPEERLFIRGTFQKGLVPQYGLTADEREELTRFLALMEFYKYERGSDGRFFFTIPYSAASADTKYDALDSITFSAFLREQGFRGEYLYWYADYCCRDDFGGGIEKVSAWAGINYFASHRPSPSNTDAARVLTWPEGNGRLIDLLLEETGSYLRTGCLVTGVSLRNGSVVINAMDFHNHWLMEIVCQHCVLAIPPFVVSHILDADLPYPRAHIDKIQHVPWMVAAVTLSGIPQGRGAELCWDNVGYGTRALGYVYNQHQSLLQRQEKTCISLYLPLDEKEPDVERKAALARTPDEWKAIVLAELELMHPHSTEMVEDIEVWVWGHGMAMPSVGLVRSGILRELARPIDNRIFFAHTDLTGYSTFEEGFDWGYRTAEAILSHVL